MKIKAKVIASCLIFACTTLIVLAICAVKASRYTDVSDHQYNLALGFVILIGTGCIGLVWYLTKDEVDDPDSKYKDLAKDLISGKKHWYLVGMNRNTVWTVDVLSPRQIRSNKSHVRAQKTTEEIKQALDEERVMKPTEVKKIIDFLDQI